MFVFTFYIRVLYGENKDKDSNLCAYGPNGHMDRHVRTVPKLYSISFDGQIKLNTVCPYEIFGACRYCIALQ